MSSGRQIKGSRFFTRGAPEVARDLLGRVVRTEFEGEVTGGRIVEVEAYRQDDPASHCYGGPSRRNRAMYLEGGHLYVYFVYGMHHCMNVVTGREGYGEAVLIRAIEPVEGIDIMRRRRGAKVKERDLANGPAKLVIALGVGPNQYGIDLRNPESPITLHEGTPVEEERVLVTPRIGISKGVETLWRWVIVSRESRALPRRHTFRSSRDKA